jgi:diguanylate cyclase
VSAIVAFGKTLNLRVIAEGVETTEQIFDTAWLPFHSLQGFLFGFPVSADEVAAVVAQNSSVRESRLPTRPASEAAEEAAA